MPQVQVELPTGMTKEEAQALLERLLKQTVSRKAYNKARAKAVAELIKRHQTEYDSLMKQYSASK